ncbi:MAG: hypothetical protein EHM75_13180 [Desulfobacteraceae bacterium]|nr:MAG: hypothetical protein EHM75_13180 [Desulfobacteraceae bacterium]
MAPGESIDPFISENIHLVPILHNRLEFALEVHRRFTELRPEAVAVELPPTLRDKVLAAAERLPFLSVVVYPEKSGRTVYLPIEPVDGIIEAVRLAREHSLPVFFVDRDTEGYPLFKDPLPDPYAVTQIGYEAYCRAYWEERGSETPIPDDLLRERTIASQALALGRRYQRVLLVCGLSHFSGIRSNSIWDPPGPWGGKRDPGSCWEICRGIPSGRFFQRCLFCREDTKRNVPGPGRPAIRTSSGSWIDCACAMSCLPRLKSSTTRTAGRI